MLKFHIYSLGSSYVIKQESKNSRILAPWSALQGAATIKITFLFTFLIHLRNIHVLSSVSSILFIISCELYQNEKP
ncbi:hypothetical protein COE26_27575 [Bacillus cereus]|uniref:Uncharacterized protein n=1 Tax=Bacillus cereus TaxID=1396 RepID=A0A9X8IVT6_BACCE|nr:hypothetical protein F8510_29245 [Bacillus sp. RM2(2019)]PDY31115.1 hypothetical protein COM84_03765 [Bacillus thuringiensis]PGW65302.1 hypothetical protein COE26_27575 [Bacillus cereus]PFF57945.1 hypothetical protein CN358_24880 [Bacillus thuringiensis]PGH96492.1 hypothetical protein CN898_17420 [Bacillus thuringiensis]